MPYARSKALLLAGLLSLPACAPDEGDAAAAAGASRNAAVTIIHNARIHTLDGAGTRFRHGTLAFDAAGAILAVGESRALPEAYPGARIIDAEGHVLLPGLIDAHGHLAGLAMWMTRADLTGARSRNEVIQRLRAFERTLREGNWLLGRGWDQNDWPEARFPDRADLDRAFPDRPVWLIRIDGHAAWGNSRALAAADRDLTGDWNPPGGKIHRDARGQPTGIFIDAAMQFVESAVPPISDAAFEAALDRALQALVAAGLTGVHDAGADRAFIHRLQARIAQGRLPLRVYAMADGPGATPDWLCRDGHLADPSGLLTLRAVKLFADGALGSRGAALIEPYLDDPGNRGLLFHDGDVLQRQIRHALSCGLQVAVHAIGDAANRQALDAFERVLPDFPGDPGRHRIEHAQVLAPDDIARFAALGIIASMQPTHATSDMYWAGQRLGPERTAGAYAWRSLLDAGARLALGSDFPVESVNPMFGIHAAVTRRDLQGWPPQGWFPEQQLDREEALRGFTRDAAYAAFVEDSVGSLEPGKRADFILLDRDPFEVPTQEIPLVRVLQTWIDGRRVYAAP
jgi:predicted amidohydrolase YtcJ